MSEEVFDNNKEDELLPELDPETMRKLLLESNEPDVVPTPDAEPEFIEDITPEMLIHELVAKAEDGFSGCEGLCSLSKITGWAEKEKELEESGSEYNPDNETDVEYYSYSHFTASLTNLDGTLVDLALTFESAKSGELENIRRILDEYVDMSESFKETGDLPVLRFTYAAYKYPLQGEVVFSQPSLFYCSLPEDIEESELRVLHVIFNGDNTAVNTRQIAQEELIKARENVNAGILEED